MKNGKNLFNKKDNSRFYLIAFVVLFLALVARIVFVGATNNVKVKTDNVAGAVAENTVTAPVELSFSDVLRRANDIKTMEINKDDIATGVLKDGTPYRATITYNPELLEKLSAGGTAVSINRNDSTWDMIGKGLPIAVSVLFLFWLLRLLRGGSGGGAGGITRSLIGQNPTKITTGKTKTTFKDVAGIDSEKQELMEVVEFLKNKDKFKSLGARVPRGVLLSGEPGTGKTLLARAVAGEANVPFFATSGSDFSGIIVGLGVAKIKEIWICIYDKSYKRWNIIKHNKTLF